MLVLSKHRRLTKQVAGIIINTLNSMSTLGHKQYQILDIKNSHLVYVKDQQSELPYMSEVTTSDGHKGIVLKIAQDSTTVIGMYHNFDTTVGDKVHISNINKSLLPNSQALSPNKVYSLDLDPLAQVKDISQNFRKKSEVKRQNKKMRLKSTSPLLSLCHDIYVGDLVAFSGYLGTGRTAHALDMIECFTNSNLGNTWGIYCNTNASDRGFGIKAASIYNTLAFGRDIIGERVNKNLKKPQLSSVGVYMLAIRCIQNAIKMKNENKNVMLVIDNIHQILANQWTILQNLKLPISPYPILNEIYSNCCDNTNKQSKKLSKQSGSLTTIIISNNQQQDVIQQYNKFGNNSKYLRTLCPHIEFPLQPVINNNKVPSDRVLHLMRRKLNYLIREKRQKQVLTKLKLNKDQPWQNYFVLDSEWWNTAIKTYKPKAVGDLDLFLWFVNKNIEEDLCAHWRVACIDAYNRYLQYLAQPEVYQGGKDDQMFDNFVQICKAQKIFDIYKKDYLL